MKREKASLLNSRWQTVKNVEIDLQTTEIWPKELLVKLSVRECMSDALVKERILASKKVSMEITK